MKNSNGLSEEVKSLSELVKTLPVLAVLPSPEQHGKVPEVVPE